MRFLQLVGRVLMSEWLVVCGVVVGIGVYEIDRRAEIDCRFRTLL
jgi:hypothetical protein